MDFSYLIISIAVLMPGFIELSTVRRFSYREKIPTFEYTLTSILLSIVVWTIVIFIMKLFQIISFINETLGLLTSDNSSVTDIENYIPVLLFLLIVYLFSLFFGFLVGKIFYKLKKQLINFYFKCFGRSYYTTVWDEVFDRLIYNKDKEPIIILVRTISKEFFIGDIETISDNYGDTSILFSKVQKYDTIEKAFLPVAMNYGFFISSKNIEYIHILPGVEEFDFDNYCKNEEIDLELRDMSLINTKQLRI